MLRSIAGTASSSKAMPSLPKRKSVSPEEESLNLACSVCPAVFLFSSEANTMMCSPGARMMSGKMKVILSARSDRP